MFWICTYTNKTWGESHQKWYKCTFPCYHPRLYLNFFQIYTDTFTAFCPQLFSAYCQQDITVRGKILCILSPSMLQYGPIWWFSVLQSERSLDAEIPSSLVNANASFHLSCVSLYRSLHGEMLILEWANGWPG